jgi:DNA mismatch repair protein MutS2
MRPIQESAAFIEAEIQKPILRKKQLFSQSPRPLKIGDRVRIHSINMLGTVATVSEEEVEVQMGSMRIRAHLNDIRRPLDPDPNIAIKEPAIKPPILHKEKKSPITVLHPSPGVELDLRGQRAEEALDKLDKHLELAYLAALPMVRIIHGKGTGRLRQAIRDSLRRSPMVTGWEVGMDGEGGEGVTIARILPADE